MKGLRSIPKILKINSINGHFISCLFNNGESRIINIKDLLVDKLKISKQHPAFKLFEDRKLFKKAKLLGNTIGWEMIGVKSKDDEGNEVFYPFELDPLVLFDNSIPDDGNSINIGLMIKQHRTAAGMTQEELAEKTGTTKYYISRLENNKSDIEFLTLKKIVEAGFGGYLEIKIMGGKDTRILDSAKIITPEEQTHQPSAN